MRQLLGDLMLSQAPGVADLLLPFRRLAAQDMELARTVALTTMKIGLAPWENAAIRDISGHDDLDLVLQLQGVPTVLMLHCPDRWSETYGPYVGGILYALAARLARLGAGPQEAHTPITVGSLPVGMILTGWPGLGRLDALFRIARGHVPILATAPSITQFNPFYPARQEAERLLAGMATHIVSADCDHATAEVVSRLGSGLILPGDVTGLAADHAIVLTAGGEKAEPARLAFHGVPTSFFKRKDWEMKSHRIQPIHVAHRQPPLPSPPAPASSQPKSPPRQTVQNEQQPEPVADQPKPRHPKNDAIERLLADAPETGKQESKDPWADEE